MSGQGRPLRFRHKCVHGKCAAIKPLQLSIRKASPGPVPPGDYRRAPLAVYSAGVGSVTVPGWPMAAMAARCK